MKKIVSIITIILLMSLPLCVYASNNNGADAHSQSMSAGSEELLVDESGSMNEEVKQAEQTVEEDIQEESTEPAGEELAEEAEEATDNMFSALSNNWIYIAAGLGAVVLIIVILVAYKPRH